MPAVSVIVPVYNTEKYLEECIRSLTEQTLSSLELIFVDDGSTDASPKILERYRARDPEHIRVITQKNAGQGKARNVGLAAATGEYVGFVDSAIDHYLSKFDEAFKGKDRKSTRLNSSHYQQSRMPSSA